MTVIQVPETRGSSSATAFRLAEGAALLAGLVSGHERVLVEPGGTLAETAARVRAALPGDGFVITVGGDCGVELEPIARAVRRYGERLAVVWFDAHADLNTPESSPSGAFHGMVLRTLLGEGPAELVPDAILRPEQVVLSGVRAMDEGEKGVVPDSRQVPDGTTAVYVHIDLDVLDPSAFSSVGCPEIGGLLPGELLARVTALAERYEIAGLGITEYEPTSARDRRTLAELVPALVGVCEAAAHWQVERRAAAAWPAVDVEERSGWLLRHTPGVPRKRSNSALTLLAGAYEPGVVEDFYAARELPPRVQIGPAERHRGLDALLAARGWEMDGEVRVMTAFARDVPAAEGWDVVDDTELWMGRDHPDLQILSRIATPAAYLSVPEAGKALVVADSGWAGVFSMRTEPAYRRKGVAAAILAEAARWALSQGADRMYLQVESDNDPALSLYGEAGFTVAYSYHHRLLPRP
jgi:GNAT superfamily N-acetyltransferase